MADKIKWLLADLIHSAALVANPEPVLPVANVMQHGSHLVMRSTSLVTQTITATWEVSQAFDTAAIGQHNLTNTAQVTVDFYETPGGQLVGSFSPVIKPVITVFPLVVTVTDTSNPKGYVQLGRLVAGAAFVPDFNMAYGLSLEMVDTGHADRARSGAKIVFAGLPYRKISMTFSHLSNENRSVLQSFLTQLGYTQSIFVSCYPNWVDVDLEKDYEGFFHLAEPLRISHDRQHQWAVQVTLEDSELIA